MVIMAKYINNNSDSFININDFDLDNNRATINEEDKGPIFSPILKKTRRGTRILLIGQRI